MRSSRVTIADLARSLQLSTCTVSKILNRSFNGFTYSKETILRVETAAQKMGYTANAQARSLRTRKTMLVGFLLPSAQVSIFGALTDQLEMALRRHGYQVLIVHSRNDSKAEASLIASLLGRGIDGLIWIPSRGKIRPADVGLPPDFPTVILDRPGCTKSLPFVATDNRAASRELAQRIHALGHRRIGLLNAAEGDQSMRERLDGFRDVYEDDSLCVNDIRNEIDEAKDSVTSFFFDEKGRPAGTGITAVVALSELLAIGGLMGLRDLGLRIPEDVSFASFDDFPLASHWSPRLTVVRQDVAELAASTVSLFLQRLSQPSEPVANVRIPAVLEWRDSVIPRVD